MVSLAGALALNSLRGGATARIVDSTVEAHTVGVMASTHDAVIDATTAFGPALRNTPSTDLVMGAVIALNVVGQDISTDALIALNLVEAVLGSTFDGATPEPFVVIAEIRDSTVRAHGDLNVTALADPVINATVSNVAEAEVSRSVWGASLAASAVIASNKVNASARASVGQAGDRGLGQLRKSVTVDGSVAVTATTAAGIFSNVKVVANSVTTVDGGVHHLTDWAQDAIAANWTTNQGTQLIHFGDRVRLDPSTTTAAYVTGSAAPSPVTVHTGDVVRLDDAYGTARLSTDSGLRLLRTGEVVELADGYTLGGIARATYRFLGTSGRLDLGAQNYADTSRWVLVSGDPGARYRYLGPTTTLNLDNVHYLDAARWAPVSGAAGSVYQYLGPDGNGAGITLDLAGQNYADLGLWRKVSVTTLLPDGFNLTQAPSVALGAAFVLNDVDARTAAEIIGYAVNAGLVSGSVVVSATNSATILAVIDVTASSSGGSSITGLGTSFAANALLVTNRILGGTSARIDDSSITTPTGSLTITATDLSVIEARLAAAVLSAGTSASILVSFNTIGLQRTNLLYATLDSLLGADLLTNASPVGAIAELVNSRVDVRDDVSVVAASDAEINSLVTNAATSAPAAMFGASGLSLAAVLSTNRVRTEVQSKITYSDRPRDLTTAADGTALTRDGRVRVDDRSIYEYVNWANAPPSGSLSDSTQHYATNANWQLVSLVRAGGNVTVTASDRATIEASTSLKAGVSKTNDAGAGIINNWAGDKLADYQFTSKSGTRQVHFGDLLRVADDWTAPATAVQPGLDLRGRVLQYMGTDAGALLNLATQDFTDYALWKLLSPSVLIPPKVASTSLTLVSKLANMPALTGAANGYYGIIAFNELSDGATARITGATVRAGGAVTVSADEGARLGASDDSVVSSPSTGGILVTNVLLAGAAASIEHSAVSTSSTVIGDITVEASTTAQLDAQARSVATSPDVMSAVIAFNSIGWAPSNLAWRLAQALLGDAALTGPSEQPSSATAYVIASTLTAGRHVRVAASDRAELNALAGNDNIAKGASKLTIDPVTGPNYGATLDQARAREAGFGMSGSAVGAILALNKVSAKAAASVDAASTITAGGDVTVQAIDDAAITAHSSIVQDAAATMTLALLLDLANNLLATKGSDYTTASGTRQIVTGDRVRLGSAYAGGGVAGEVYVYGGATPVTLDLGGTNYATATGWTRLVPATNQSGLETIFPGITEASGLNLAATSARAIGIIIVTNDVRSRTTATLAAPVTAGGAVRVEALGEGTIRADVESNVAANGGSFLGAGSVLSVGGIAATNVVLADATATVTADVTAASLTVLAELTTGIDATVASALLSAGNGASFVLAFNSIGWASQNLLFNLVDALLADPLISSAFGGNDIATASASVTGAKLTLTGALDVSARSAARLNATVSNAASSVASALYGATGAAVGGILASNKVSSAASATLTGVTVRATDVGVHASDDAGIYANVKIVSSSITTNSSGTSILNSVIGGRGRAADWTSSQGTRTLDKGDLVVLDPNFGSPVATTSDAVHQVVSLTPGAVVALDSRYGTGRLSPASGIRLVSPGEVVTIETTYAAADLAGSTLRYVGPAGRLDLGLEDYRDATRWARIGGTPGGLYRWLGTATSLDVNTTDFTDTTLWRAMAGTPGTTYEWMGEDGTSVDLSTGTRAVAGATETYADLGWWKPVATTRLFPGGFNLRD